MKVVWIFLRGEWLDCIIQFNDPGIKNEGGKDRELVQKPLDFLNAETVDHSWMQNPESSPGEAFADMFLGYVYNDIFSNGEYGEARKTFMDTFMPGWIYQAMSK